MRRLLATVVLLIATAACAPRTGLPPDTAAFAATRADSVAPSTAADKLRTVELRVDVASAYGRQDATQIIERVMDAFIGHPGYSRHFYTDDDSREIALERVIEEFDVRRLRRQIIDTVGRIALVLDFDPFYASDADVIIVVTVSEPEERFAPSGLELSLSLRVGMVESQSRAPVTTASGSMVALVTWTDDNGAGELPREVRAQLIAQALPSLVTAAAQQAFDDLFAQLD